VRNYKISSKQKPKWCIKFVKSPKSQLFNIFFGSFLHIQGKKLYFCKTIHCTTHLKTNKIMKSLGYIGAFLGGAIAGAALGILMAPEKGQDTRVKLTDAIEDFLNKHNIKLSRKEVVDLVDDIQDASTEE